MYGCPQSVESNTVSYGLFIHNCLKFMFYLHGASQRCNCEPRSLRLHQAPASEGGKSSADRHQQRLNIDHWNTDESLRSTVEQRFRTIRRSGPHLAEQIRCSASDQHPPRTAKISST